MAYIQTASGDASEDQTNGLTTSSTQFMLDSNAEELPELQARLMSLCQEAGLNDMGGFQFTVAIIEAVANCIEHAYDWEQGHPISLLWLKGPGKITVEIRDQGRPMTAPTEMPVDALSGRGRKIINEWADSVMYQREAGENLLILTRNLQ